MLRLLPCETIDVKPNSYCIINCFIPEVSPMSFKKGDVFILTFADLYRRIGLSLESDFIIYPNGSNVYTVEVYNNTDRAVRVGTGICIAKVLVLKERSESWLKRKFMRSKLMMWLSNLLER